MSHISTTQQTSFWQSKTFIALVIIAALVIGFVLYRKKSAREIITGIFKKK